MRELPHEALLYYSAQKCHFERARAAELSGTLREHDLRLNADGYFQRNSERFFA